VTGQLYVTFTNSHLKMELKSATETSLILTFLMTSSITAVEWLKHYHL
jgi:hypothetical protein